MTRTTRVIPTMLTALVSLGLVACTERLSPVNQTDAQGDGDGDGDGAGDGDGDGTGDGDGDGDGVPTSRDVDILFVIDNSGTMAVPQAKLTAGFAVLAEILEGPDVEANYRIGFTSSDRGQGTWCNSGTIDNGKLQLSSCLDRPQDFVFNGNDGLAIACSDRCPYGDESLAIEPTTTHVSGGVAESRPWLERIDGDTNFPGGVSLVDVFACMAPQGINGCGFESQLESQYVALVRADKDGEESYGFLRDTALLVVVQVTNEADCSNNQEWSDIFLDDSDGGNQVFWADTDVDWPSSAVCWNAGVECAAPDPDGYHSDCWSVDRDVNGAGTDDPDAAVLYSVARYTNQLASLEAVKQAADGRDQPILFALIGGVDDGGDPIYQSTDGPFPGHTDDYGIGPGCIYGEGDQMNSGIPPVRLRSVAEAFDGGMYSVCGDSYAPAFAEIGERIKAQLAAP